MERRVEGGPGSSGGGGVSSPRRRRYLILTVPEAEEPPAAAGRQAPSGPRGRATTSRREPPPRQDGPGGAGARTTATGPAPFDAEQTAVRRFSKTRRQLIEEAAYFRAERRGFAPGDPEEDWRAAEAEVEAMLREAKPF